MQLKSEMIWTRIGQVIRLRNYSNFFFFFFFETLDTFQMRCKSLLIQFGRYEKSLTERSHILVKQSGLDYLRLKRPKPKRRQLKRLIIWFKFARWEYFDVWSYFFEYIFFVFAKYINRHSKKFCQIVGSFNLHVCAFGGQRIEQHTDSCIWNRSRVKHNLNLRNSIQNRPPEQLKKSLFNRKVPEFIRWDVFFLRFIKWPVKLLASHRNSSPWWYR